MGRADINISCAVTATDLINFVKSQVAADTTTALTVDGIREEFLVLK